MHCSACGFENPLGTRFCSKCGALLGPQAPAPYAAPGSVAPYPPGGQYPQGPQYAGGGPMMVAPPANSQGYAGFGLRLVAYLIDGFVLTPVILIVIGAMVGLFLLAGGARSFRTPEDVSAMMSGIGVLAYLVGQLLLLVAMWLYFAGMESSKYQGTLGKIAMGLKVTDQFGNPVTFGRATGRLLGKMISGFTFGIGYLMIAFTERRQALHDIISGCLVLRK